jgi:hypothetical protein
MGFFHKLMVKLGRYRLIPDRRTGEDYMHRYYLFLKDRSWFPFNFTLHKIVKSDDPIFHDHPWSYMTIVLKGGYWEWTPVFDSSAGEYHWLELDPEVGPATTLFFMGPQQREWGFLVDKAKKKTQWIQWEHYLNNYKDYHNRYIQPKVTQMASKKKD